MTIMIPTKGGNNTGSVISGTRVLLIEKEKEQAEHTRTLLRGSRIDTHITPTIQDAVHQMVLYTFDAIALDMDTEDSSRLIGLLLDLKHTRNTLLLAFPICASEDRSSLLIRGFDMCLTKRVSEEVCAAICALLRRPSLSEYSLGSAPPVQIVHKGIMMDPLRQKVTIDGVEVVLTALEFKLLYLLASNPSIVFSKERIYERLWSENSIYGCQSVVDMVCSIRKKLKISSKDSTYIKTIKGAGYCFAP